MNHQSALPAVAPALTASRTEKLKNRLGRWLAASAMLVLTACGGGGNDVRAGGTPGRDTAGGFCRPLQCSAVFS